jgi:hypothetical protein
LCSIKDKVSDGDGHAWCGGIHWIFPRQESMLAAACPKRCRSDDSKFLVYPHISREITWQLISWHQFFRAHEGKLVRNFCRFKWWEYKILNIHRPLIAYFCHTCHTIKVLAKMVTIVMACYICNSYTNRGYCLKNFVVFNKKQWLFGWAWEVPSVHCLGRYVIWLDFQWYIIRKILVSAQDRLVYDLRTSLEV